MPQELELIEENSESCPVETMAPGVGGVPLWVLAIVGLVMIVGFVYMGGEKKPGAGEGK